MIVFILVLVPDRETKVFMKILEISNELSSLLAIENVLKFDAIKALESLKYMESK